MNLRLGYLVPEFPGQTHVFFWREICALRALGDEVMLLSTRKPSPLTCRHEFVAGAVAETRYLFPPSFGNGVAWLGQGLPGVGQARRYLGGLAKSDVKTSLKRLALLASAVDLLRWSKQNRIDHIHGHSCADAAHVLALAHTMGGPPYSLTLHGDLEVYGSDHASKMRDAAFISVVGEHLRQQVLQQVGIPEDRVLPTCMGVETSRLSELGANRQYEKGVLRLVTVARLNPVKGHVHALAAIRLGVQQGLDLHYTIAGDGPHEAAIAKAIREHGLESRVTMTGTLPETGVLGLLSAADAFLLPSIGSGEAWPVSVMEAMGAGLPVISSIIGATPEMIISGTDGYLVAQRDESGLAEYINILAADTDTRRRIGTAARLTAQRRFDVRATAKALRDAVLSRLNAAPH
jgi:colanic acid/amylovoran biosynthesis glycosyltransferase